MGKSDGRKLGAGVDSSDGQSLLITAVRLGGLLADWNNHNAALEVRQNDRIIRVNGVEGSSARILEEVASAHEFEMTIRRQGQPGQANKVADAVTSAANSLDGD